MDKRYNLDSLEASFRSYLTAGNTDKLSSNKLKALSKITVKNYLSDFRHFLGWAMYMSKTIEIDTVIGTINTKLIHRYKSELINNLTPPKTVNRRLSTIRKFCTFCVEIKLLSYNAANLVPNIDILQNQTPSLIEEFNTHLKEQNPDNNTNQSYVSDVKDFFNEVGN